jgi:hypothetical protein
LNPSDVARLVEEQEPDAGASCPNCGRLVNDSVDAFRRGQRAPAVYPLQTEQLDIHGLMLRREGGLRSDKPTWGALLKATADQCGRGQEGIGRGLDRAAIPFAQRQDLPRRRSSLLGVPDNVSESRTR